MQDIRTVILSRELRAYIAQKRMEQRMLEERYNPYHDPRNGRFTTGKGSGGVNGVVLAVGKGQKGKGYYADTKDADNWKVLARKGATQEQLEDLINGKNVASQATNSEHGLTDKPKKGTIEGDGNKEAVNRVINNMKAGGVEYREVNDLEKPLTEGEIIDKLGGGDLTKGSCASLAYAYCANKAGYDVTDYRGGESQEIISRSSVGRLNASSKVTGEPGIPTKVLQSGRNGVATPGKKLKFMKDNIAEGEEYFVDCAKHAAIVKKEGGKLHYLELQQEPGKRYKSGIGVKGWKPMTKATTFKKRFGDESLHGFYGRLTMAKVSDVPKMAGFKEMMGYINTAPEKQQKGAKGYAK